MITKKMDTFESRLQQVLTMEDLSPAKFADMLGIQRSGISHLLSGRNNPSFDFITRMLDHFPELNADWLLMGKGKPYKDAQQASMQEEARPQAQPQLQLQPQPQPQAQALQMPQLFEDEFVESKIKPSQVPENAIFAPKVEDSPADRRIVRVTIFYSDGTYEEK